MTGSETHNPVTPASIGRILWRQKLVSAVLFLLIAIIGSTIVLTRPTTYQSSSSVALLPVATNANVLPNYPNLITSLIPTYVQLVSSPAMLDRVAAGLPFPTSGSALANHVSAQSLSNAAVINIVAQSGNPTQARQIATETTRVFLSELHGNGVVVPKIYGLPSASPTPAPPSTSLLLILVLILAAILALAAGLIWDRLSAATRLGATGPARPEQTDTETTAAASRDPAATEPDKPDDSGWGGGHVHVTDGVHTRTHPHTTGPARPGPAAAEPGDADNGALGGDRSEATRRIQTGRAGDR